MQIPELNKLHLGMPYSDYHAIDALRSGDLHHMLRSPAHLFASRQNPKPPSPAMELGRIFHLGVEEPLTLKELLLVEPKFTGKSLDGRESDRSKEAKEKRLAWYHEVPADAIVVTQEEADRLTGMLRAVNSHTMVSRIIRDGLREASGVVSDPETGILLKFRPDLISQKKHYVIDFKTTRDASQRFFTGEIFSDRGRYYILNAAHYAHCAKLTESCSGDSFIIVAIESEAPFGLNVFPLDQFCLDVGERVRARLTKQYAECLKSGIWPSYPEKAIAVQIPNYVQWDDV